MAKKKGKKRKGTMGQGQAAGPSEAVRGLIKAGEAALESYDYDGAESHFLEAIALDQTVVAPWAALLDFWISHLAADDRALEKLEAIPGSVRAHHSVASPLAMAAARRGDTVQALRLVGDASERVAGDVYLTLARGAVAKSAGAEAEGYFKRAMALIAAKTPSILQLEEQISALVVGELGQLEGKMAEAQAAGDWDGALKLAHDILARKGQHAGAQAIVDAHRQREKASEIERLVALADGAMVGGDPAQAAEIWRQALVLGASAEELGPRIRAAEGQVRRAQNAAAIAQVKSLFEAQKIGAGLMAYGGLDDDMRALLREELHEERLAILEECGVHKGQKWVQSAVDAILALPHIQSALDAERLSDAKKALLHHEKILRRLSAAQGLWHTVADLEARERAAKIEGVTARFQGALADGALSKARAIAQQLKEMGVALTPEQIATYQAIEAHEKHIKGLQHLLDGGDLLSARDFVDARILAGHRVETWRAEAQKLQVALDEKWRCQCLSGGDAGFLSLADMDLWRDPAAFPLHLGPGGRRLFHGVTHGDWLFIRGVELPSGRLNLACSLKVPTDFTVKNLAQGGDHLWVTSEEGAILILDVKKGRVERLIQPASLVESGHDYVDGAYFSQGDRLWSQSRKGYGDGQVIVHNPARLEKITAIPGLFDFFPLPGKRPRVGVIDEARDARVYDVDGQLQYAIRPGRAGSVKALAHHPSGQGLVMVMTGVWNDEGDDAGSVFWAEAHEDGNYDRPQVIEGSTGVRPRAIQSDGQLGLVFIVFNSVTGVELLALERCESGLKEKYRLEVPPSLELLSLPSGQGVYAVSLGSIKPEFSRLNGFMPRFQSPFQRRPAPLPQLFGPFKTCRPEHQGAAAGFRMAYQQLGKKERGPWLNRYKKAYEDAPEQLLSLAYSLEALESMDAAADFLSDAMPRHADDWNLCLLLAEYKANQRDWQGVIELLSTVKPPEGEGAPRHYFHLLALAHFHRQNYQGALEAIEGAQVTEGRCALAGLHYMASRRVGDPAFATVGDQSPAIHHRLSALMKAVEQSDRARQARRARDVKAWLARANIWWSGELQCMARLTDTYLDERARAGSSGEFEGRLVAAAYLSLFEGDDPFNLPLGEARYDASQLNALAKRARAFLAGK